MAKKIQVHVDTLEGMGRWFVEAWRRVQAGVHGEEEHVTFLSFAAMTEILSTRRLELLRHVHRHGAASTRELAHALGRDYKNVYEDVRALIDAGLLVREGRRLIAPLDEVQSSIRLAA